jgi:HEAT repeat protein
MAGFSGESNNWSKVISQIEVVDRNPDLIVRLKDGEQIRRELLCRLKEQPLFAQEIRTSLRNDNRVWVRVYAAKILIQAFGNEGATEDYIAILSDPEQDVRGLGIVGANVYRIRDVASSVGVGLLSTNSAERFSALEGINRLIGWKGLPYYAALLYDRDEDIATSAARALRSCRKEDVAPHLFRYLTQSDHDKRKRVTVAVIKSIYEIYGEPTPKTLELDHEIGLWRERFASKASPKSRE